MNSRKIDNIFDEMYLSVKYPKISATSFHYMREVGRLTELMDVDDRYLGVYKKSLLNYGEEIDVFINTEKEIVIINSSIELETDNKRCLYFTYNYSFKTKTLDIEPLTVFTYDYFLTNYEMAIDDAVQVDAFLHEHQITREYIEKCRDYFLYDKLLTDWVNGNGKRSRFTVGNYGNYKIEDNLFSNLGEGWRL